jgi:hypothetical protein
VPCTRADTSTLYASIRHPPSIHPYKVHVHASFCTCMHLARRRALWCTCPRAATLPCAFFPACHRFSRRGSCEVGNRCVADPAICSCALLLAVCTCYGARLRFFFIVCKQSTMRRAVCPLFSHPLRACSFVCDSRCARACGGRQMAWPRPRAQSWQSSSVSARQAATRIQRPPSKPNVLSR